MPRERRTIKSRPREEIQGFEQSSFNSYDCHAFNSWYSLGRSEHQGSAGVERLAGFPPVTNCRTTILDSDRPRQETSRGRPQDSNENQLCVTFSSHSILWWLLLLQLI